MLIVVRVELTTMEILNNVLAHKEITVTGQAVSLYPEDDYIKELEEKARRYDELMDLGETIAESMFSSVEKEAKEKSIEILKDFSKLGFLGHNIKPRESF
ncbi:MAG: hypothetical protein ACEQSQ_00050 [Candidatus Paceibacteria bacterium]